MNAEKVEKTYLRALAIRDGQAMGLWLPIIQHLALRQHPDAMIELASWLWGADFFKAADRFRAAGLYRRAYRKGQARAAQHMAMNCFNRNDLAGYRLWLRRAARLGDGACALELKRFELRLPHATAGDIRRLRSEQKRDEFA